MFFILSKIGEILLSPTHLVLLLAALGVMLLFTRFAKAGRGLAAFCVAAMLAMFFVPLGEALVLPLENRFPAPPEDAPEPDGVIVLGGSVDEDVSMAREHTALNDAAERLTALVELARRYPKARLVFTGGSASLLGATHTEAEAAERFFLEMGVEPGRVLYEGRSRNTWENAVETRALVAPKPTERWLLVTSAFHMPRSIGIFRRIGFPVVAYPVDYRTTGSVRWTLQRKGPEALRLVETAAHEWLGLVVYRLTGKTDALLPAP
jgi:uncharacterized SAM-binding protein YcdF (DUF218 family)